MNGVRNVLRYSIFALFAIAISSGCNKPYVGSPEIVSASYDTLKATATIKYLNCSNTFTMTISTNKGKLLTDIEEAGYGDKNLAVNDSAQYTVSLTDTAHNHVKPFNLLHSGDSIYVNVYLNTGKTVPVGPYGFTINLIVKSNNIYIVNDQITQFKPHLKDEYLYTGYYVMP